MNNTSWIEWFKNTPQFPQRQDSTMDQLIDLIKIANKLGFYDAADFIKGSLKDNE